MTCTGPLGRLRSVITTDCMTLLRRQGYVVLDGAVDNAWKTSLREEIDQLRTTNRLHLNSTHLVTERGAATQYLEKSNIWEAELADTKLMSDCPALTAVEHDKSLVAHLNRRGLSQSKYHCLQNHSTKVQYNAGGGGCFPLHFDTDPALDTRRLTVIMYLNRDRWNPADGGQLQLAPWPRPPVEIDPVGGRVVVFSSADLAHRVLPSRIPRYCLTMWLWAKDVADCGDRAGDGNGSSDTPDPNPGRGARFVLPRRRQQQARQQQPWKGAALNADYLARLGEASKCVVPGNGSTQNYRYDAEGRRAGPPATTTTTTTTVSAQDCVLALQVVMQPQYRRHAVRWAMAEDWARSIAESHPAGAATDAALEVHWREVGVIERALVQAILADGRLVKVSDSSPPSSCSSAPSSSSGVVDLTEAESLALAVLCALRQQQRQPEVIQDSSSSFSDPVDLDLVDWFGS